MTQQQFIDEFTSLPDEAQRKVASFMALLRQSYQVGQRVDEAHKVDFGDELVIGMWGDREDMEDSTAWVRRLRKEHWGDGS